jgi:AraC-like DNA-binding protein
MADAIAELPLTQEAGEPPTVLAAGSGPGEHGLAVIRFRGGVHIESPSPRSHLVWFQLSDLFIECRRASRVFCEAAIEPSYLTLAAAEDSAFGPHRYVVLLGLQRATEPIRHGRSGLAEIAACTGFADQSHLARWVRCVRACPLPD